jgi:hypothetical protein
MLVEQIWRMLGAEPPRRGGVLRHAFTQIDIRSRRVAEASDLSRSLVEPLETARRQGLSKHLKMTVTHLPALSEPGPEQCRSRVLTMDCRGRPPSVRTCQVAPQSHYKGAY